MKNKKVKILNEKKENYFEKQITNEFSIKKDDLIIMVLNFNTEGLTDDEIKTKMELITKKQNTKAGFLEKWIVLPTDGETSISCVNPIIIEKGERPEVEKQ